MLFFVDEDLGASLGIGLASDEALALLLEGNVVLVGFVLGLVDVGLECAVAVILACAALEIVLAIDLDFTIGDLDNTVDLERTCHILTLSNEVLEHLVVVLLAELVQHTLVIGIVLQIHDIGDNVDYGRGGIVIEGLGASLRGALADE